jgi:hypothetical protein
MVDRATRGGGVARPLSGLPALVPQLGSGGADWFGPSAPLPPIAPPEVEGRTWDYPANYNLNVQSRPFEPIKFPMLMALADSYDLLRIVIETRKDQMARQVPNVVPLDPKAPASADRDARIKAATALIQEPYPGIEWEEWLRRILEDLFVLDAPAAYVRRRKNGEVFGIKPIAGSTINRVLDPWGDTPEPPNAAYVQILKGLGAVHYTTDQLIYRPRNPRNNRAFGFGPVEQIITIVNLGLRRETWQLNYFTEGNLPDALIGTPMEWTPDQIRNFQDWFDARLSGNSSRRRGATFVPGDVAKGYVATKETELFGVAEEWLARVVCFAFSTSPQPFLQMMNRATAGTAKDTATEEGLDPIKAWVSRFWTYVFRTFCGWTDIGLGWLEEDDTDPKTQAEIQDILVKGGVKSRNEARKALGEEPDPSPEADSLMVTTATGVLHVDGAKDLAAAKAKIDIQPKPVAPGGGGKSPPAGGSGAGRGGGKAKAGGPAKAVVGAGSPPFAMKAGITPDRPLARRAQSAIRRALKAALADTADDVAAQVAKALADAHKADEPQGGAREVGTGIVDVAALVDSLDLSGFDVVVDVVEDALHDVAADSAKRALAQVGTRVPEDVVDRVNEAAVDFARDRAAELVGKRWTADGELIDNPSPAYAITDETRTSLRGLIAKGLEDNIGTPAIAESIQESYTFSAARAALIAYTEVANANGQGKLQGWREGGSSAGLTLMKVWQTTNDENECQDCADNAAQGPIGVDDDFQSGDDAEPAHPNCQCVTYVEIVDSADQSEGGDEADVD